MFVIIPSSRLDRLEDEIADLKELAHRYEVRSRIQRDLNQDFAREIMEIRGRLRTLQERLNG